MLYSFPKFSEGGPSKQAVLAELKRAGIPARGATSPYIGHTAVEVRSKNKRVLKRAARIIFRP